MSFPPSEKSQINNMPNSDHLWPSTTSTRTGTAAFLPLANFHGHTHDQEHDHDNHDNDYQERWLIKRLICSSDVHQLKYHYVGVSAKYKCTEQCSEEQNEDQKASTNNGKPTSKQQLGKSLLLNREAPGKGALKTMSSHSLAERVRRERINERMKFLQDLVPGCNKITGKALMLDEIINYVQSLQRQVEFLSMKLVAVYSEMEVLDNNMEPPLSEDIHRSKSDQNYFSR